MLLRKKNSKKELRKCRGRAGFADFVPDCKRINLFLVGWVMYLFVRFSCRFYLTNTPEFFGKRALNFD